MADTARARKLAKRISQIVASALEHEVKDPRLARVTITDTKVTGDLHDATVYYTVLGERLDVRTGPRRGRRWPWRTPRVCCGPWSGAQTGVRFTPTLTFVTDTVPDDARKMEELLAKARAADAEVARLAVGSGSGRGGRPVQGSA